MKTAITVRHAFTPLESVENAVVIIEDERILAVGRREALEIPAGARQVDLGDAVLAPGFIDIHIHGGAGHDVMASDADGLARFEHALTKHGVTSYCPTTVTAPLDTTYRSLEWLASAKSQAREHGHARPIGIHLEGPFISHAKRGVHPPDLLVEPSPALLEKFWQAAAGNVAVMTIAPELPGAIETIRAAAKKGICVSLGHSNATLTEAQAGIAAGGRHSTHTFNAMRTLDHREPGVLGEVLYNDSVTSDIIADGIHVHPEMVDIFLRAKGLDRAVLITDAMSATGMGDGKFRLGSFEVEVKGDRAERDGVLAGSVLTLDRAVRNVAKFANLNLQHAIRLATLNPARVLAHQMQPDNDIGIIAAGARADFVVLSASGEVQHTILGGFIA